jgi:hypothetical protein
MRDDARLERDDGPAGGERLPNLLRDAKRRVHRSSVPPPQPLPPAGSAPERVL